MEPPQLEPLQKSILVAVSGTAEESHRRWIENAAFLPEARFSMKGHETCECELALQNSDWLQLTLTQGFPNFFKFGNQMLL